MKRLSKEQLQRRAVLAALLGARQEAVEVARELTNDRVSRLNETISAYNEALEEARDFVEEITADMTEFFDEKSDRWTEGDAGQAYSSWKDEWEGFDGDEVDAVDEVEVPDLGHAEELEQLPEEPG
jgi:uncharacterized protein YukE